MSDLNLESLYQICDRLPGQYIVFEEADSQLRYLHFTPGIPAMIGLSDEDFSKDVKDGLEKIVYEEDRSIIQERMKEGIAATLKASSDILIRVLHKTKGFIWVHVTTREYGEHEGHTVYLSGITETTKETMLAYTLMDASDRYVCVIEKSTKRFLYANTNFLDLVHSSTAESMGKYCYELLCGAVAMKDNDNCLCYSSINADPPIETYFPDSKKYFTLTGREVVWGEYDAYVFYLTDVTDKKRKEEELLDSQKRFEIALDRSSLMVWEYDMVNNLCINSAKAGRDYNIPLVIENYPESLFTTGHTPPETIEQIKDVKRRLLNGETGFSMDRRTIDKYGKSQWQRVDYTLEKDENGKPIRAIVCGFDITEQKELERKYEDQMAYRNKLAENAAFSAHLDLDSNTVSDYTCGMPELKEIVTHAKDAEDFLNQFFSTSEFEEDSEIQHSLLHTEALKENYAIGRSQFHCVYRCNLLGNYFDLVLTLYKRPGSRHLELFFVLTDVSKNILMQHVFQKVAKRDYDIVSVIDAQTQKADFILHSDDILDIEYLQSLGLNYEELMDLYVKEYRKYFYTEEDYQSIMEKTRLAVIKKELKNHAVYEFNIKVKNEEMPVQILRFSYTYVNALTKQIVFTRADITALVTEEQERQEALSSALVAAEEASQTKTDFLSRMSHDMRTPMNGIIGMTRLTREIPELPNEVQENLQSIEDSSQYLLQLINDTLDMNKIESNKLVLHKDVVQVSGIIERVMSIVRPMADAKMISLQFKSGDLKFESVYTDRIRMRQVMINILSNAIKFTPEHGTVVWEVNTYERTDAEAKCLLRVTDTGCGMSKEFLDRIYEPFSQERTQIINGQEGTGLGMSIVKNLVELMGGHVEISSEVGVGTTVDVYMNFLRASEEDSVMEEQQEEKLAHLEGRRILLAEDHPLNTKIAIKLLEKKGIIVDAVENGEEAVRQMEQSAPGTYDAILMDIRMPIMDGITATKEIRKLQHPQAKIIPIVAMTANAFREDVEHCMQAGMNAHISKPVQPEILYKTLAEKIVE